MTELGFAGGERPFPHELTDQATRSLVTLLSQARRFGFLGPGPIHDQIIRSLAFTHAAGPPPGRAVDLGTGGGLPGLVLALAWPESNWLLVDSNERRATWLQKAVDYLGIASRCQVIPERAETTGQGPHRNTADLVTARSFAAPGPTAECAAPLLRRGGQLLVTEPPGSQGERWPPNELGKLGLELYEVRVVDTSIGPVTISRFISVSACPENYPRRVGVPFKRPVF
jgi:16S rRNA (guanine527-N7)-methyltransferase